MQRSQFIVQHGLADPLLLENLTKGFRFLLHFPFVLVTAVGACGCIFLLAGALILYFKKKKMTSPQEKPVPGPNIYISHPHFGNVFFVVMLLFVRYK